ncbi:MAG: VCBS repeat-containing protein, partial [Myxococcales bacterium]|nr:VCBS repeat-containing protein [Myxococcales bacterium]
MRRLRAAVAAAALVAALPGAAGAQNGLSDERVSLPDGPGSIGGVGENVDLDANMGSASFSVPIRVPEGASPAMTPSLALGYASGQGMGVAGIGWDFGTPTIERMVSRGLPGYTVADHFAANGGSELVYVGDLDGSRVYRERFEGSFVRYRWWQAGVGAAGYWTAEYPDGRVGTFGAEAGGTLVPSARVQDDAGDTFRYHLVEVRDPVGRRMVQTYVKSSGWPLLDEVRYAFGGEATPRFSVRMGYADRADVDSSATPGFEIRLAKRLATIQVLSDTTVIRRYELTYEADAASGGTTRLAGVAEYGRDGGKLPIEHHFQYTRTLAGVCAVGCEAPLMVDMGTLPGGVDIQTGRAALIDINGDSLPDVLETDVNGVHRFHVSKLSTVGQPTFTATVVTSALTAGGSSFVLSSPGVQLLDVNGDGFTDIVDQVNGIALCNTGAGDWSGTDCIANPGQLPTLADDPGDAPSDADPLGMRFFDFDNDKRIDLLRTPDASTAFVSANTGTGYVTVPVEALGAAFDAEALQLADVNGDGLQDPVMLVANGATTTLQYKLNLGFGRWSPAWTSVSLDDLPSGDLDLAALEDLDGDGLADVVLVSGTAVAYWRNRNAGAFDARVRITSADVDGEIPERTGSETVLFADMNGNGTDDVVWVASNGHVRFLELFPVRPNLLSRVDNGIGWVRIIEYGTSVAQRARDEAAGAPWASPLPQSMNVVTATDTWVTLTGGEGGDGVHERQELAYHAGFYDGVEKSFRGYEEVEQRLVTDADDQQDPALDVLRYDVGRDDPYHNGLLVAHATFGGPGLDVPIRETHLEYADCPVSGLDGAALGATDPAVRHVCATAEEVLHQEGAPAAEWRTVRTERAYDGYGNEVEVRERGVVATGDPATAPAGCGSCADLPDGVSSGACGAECLGDERITATSWVVPGEKTGGAWLLRLTARVAVRGVDGGVATERVTHYDGADFVGAPEGEATRGLVTRETERVSAGATVDAARYAYDVRGNVIASLDPNGAPGDATGHRRDYAYDARGLRVTRVTIRAGAYDLVQDVSYEASFLLPSEATAYRVVEAGEDRTPRNPTAYAYDEFGRTIAIVAPGDTREAPTQTFGYELGDPVTRVVTKARSAPGGAMDIEAVACLDGRGRAVQIAKKIDATHWQADGFKVLSSRGEVVRDYLPYLAASGACAMTPPAGVPYSSARYDAVGREVESVSPDGSLYGGTPSVERTAYGPLRISAWDADDTDPASPFAGTPTVRVVDGLERVVRIERRLTESGPAEVFGLGWDGLGRLARVTDPAGNARTQEMDLLGRVVRVVEPNAGATTYAYDAAGNVVSRTDARGIAVASRYDALNRLVARFDAADEDGTAERLTYDLAEGCSDCRNGAGRLVRATYPLLAGEVGSDEVGYDARGRRTLLRRTLDGHAFETTWAWDGVGELVSAVYPDGQRLDYGYDGASRPVSLAGIVAGATYDEHGLLTRVEHESGVATSYAFDAVLRPSGITAESTVGGRFLALTVTRDRAGRVTAIADGADAAAGRPERGAAYGYDAYYRLTSATLGAGAGAETLSFAYDAVDNVTSRTSSRGAASVADVGAYAYGAGGAGPNAATSVGGVTYAYDAAGNLTAKGALALAWDHLGRLMEAAPASGAPSEDAYAAGGERVVKTEAGGVIYYPTADFAVRDGISSLYARFAGARVARLRSDALAATLLSDANADGRVDIADAWLGRGGEQRDRLLRAAARRLLFAAGDARAHLHEDLLGSIVAATDGDGAVVAERAFYPTGEESAASGFVDELGFTGQERDATGLLHFRARYLDPASGRWTAVDPGFAVLDAEGVGNLGEGTAAYAYVANDPTNAVDPTGLKGFLKGVKSRLAKVGKAVSPKKKRARDGRGAKKSPAERASGKTRAERVADRERLVGLKSEIAAARAEVE